MGRLLARYAVADRVLADQCGEDLRAAVANADLGRMEATLRTLYSSLPHQQLAIVDRREALCAVALRALAMGAGIRSTPEESTALGRSDVTLEDGGQDEGAGRPAGAGRPEELRGQASELRRLCACRGGDDGSEPAQHRTVRCGASFPSRAGA